MLSPSPINSASWNLLLTTILPNFSDHYAANFKQVEALFNIALCLEPNEHIVELGVCNGRTAAALAWTTKFTKAIYTGIDNFKLGSSQSEVVELFVRYDLPGLIIKANTSMVYWDNPISLLFVDAGHDEASIKADCEKWVPYVRPGGVAAFHDYDQPANPESAHWAVRHYADLHTVGWEKLDYIEGLIIFRKPEE